MSNDERFPVCVVCLSRCHSPVGGTEPQDNTERRCCVCGHTVKASEIVLTDGPTADLAYATLLDALESGAFL